MSVINQMLKDLDKRNPEHTSTTMPASNVPNKHAPIKVVLITAVSVLLLCFLGFYMWHLVSENKALKAEKHQQHAVSSTKSALISAPAADHDKQLAADISQPAPFVTDNIAQQVTSTTKQVNKATRRDKVSGEQDSVDENKANSLTTAPKVDAPISKPAKIQHSIARVPAAKNRQVAQQQTVVKAPVNKMSVSRRQLSAAELSAQKLALAEKALAGKQVAKAEKLLEDVVIITPNDSQARQKLAALWFGRQAYQDAINLLSQGIALNSKDSSLREMKARIYLKQGQATAALNTLKPLAELKDEPYQIMLANTAQQAQQNDIAITAYKVLISMKPDAGRWHLGLAVLYDKNSQFTLASNAYKQALTKSDLSISSETFAQQRIQAIGQ